MHERRPDLAQIQDGQQIALFVGELVGLQRHPVLGLMAPELPGSLDTHGRTEMCLRVDHALHLLYVLLIVRLKR